MEKNALAITVKTAQFTVLNDQPRSVVNNVEFKCLLEHLEPHFVIPSHHYIVGKTIPQIHKGIKKCVASNLGSIDAVFLELWCMCITPGETTLS